MNERERLTEHFGDGVRYGNGEYTITCYPKNKNLNPVDKLAVKLCELEDKIENGTLIELPCKVGDKVYRISGNYWGQKIFEGVVDQIAIFNNREIRIWVYGHPLFFGCDDIGKTVFLTKEETEKALAEREQK